MKRRDFLQRVLCATASSSLFGALAGKLSIAHAATLAEPRLLGNDYRALVCVSLGGGNDAFNMLVPRSGTARSEYAAVRGVLALPSAGLLALNPNVAPNDGSAWQAGDCSRRSLRGGGYKDSANESPAAYRNKDPITDRDPDNGFRVVRELAF